MVMECLIGLLKMNSSADMKNLGLNEPNYYLSWVIVKIINLNINQIRVWVDPITQNQPNYHSSSGYMSLS